ncbi:zinc transporter ZIP1 [Ictalurus punctatus]|uniref:Zinc transporter ZIP1 n=1 Tax=Ictalurus punctatus TaxID=7998 RepID=A0A2D0QN75_ICTPU|nr:zinc transporter ZIP1 [Ictalurus punctatus]XP_053540770.1 zinc transporter ZIP1 [Ictalurus punctatus]
MMMSVESPVVSGVGSELVCVCVYVVCVLVCGFGALGTLRMMGRGGTPSDTRLSSLSCLSAGVFLASCLLDIIPNFLTEMRETFTELGVTLRFPVPEFIMAVGFLFLLVLEQLILTLRDECERQHGQKEGREEKEALLLYPTTFRPRPDPSLSPVRSSVLLLSLFLFSVFQGLSADVMRLRPDLLLRTSLVACSLVFLLAQSHMRRSVVSVCLAVLSSAFPLCLALRHTHTHTPLRLARSTLQGLSVGSFTYVIFMDVMPRVTSANEQRIAKVTLILTGFSLLTAALLLRT